MRAPKDCTVAVTVHKGLLGTSVLPGYIHLMHRHFEKEGATSFNCGAGKGFIGPLDMVRKAVESPLTIPLPTEILGELEEVVLVYEKAPQAL